MWVGMAKGGVTMPVFQSLEAFWPGVLSLIGDHDSAMRILLTYRQVLRQYGFTPEFFNIPNTEAVAKRSGYPLRPELIESTMYLYRATGDPQLLQIGAELVEVIEHSARTACGYATVHNVKDHTIEDRMESFFLSETAKYLFLLFDEDNFIHNPGASGDLVDTPGGKCVVNSGGYIFNTEAHPVDPSQLYCCSQQRQKDLDLVHEFEQNLDFLEMLGIPSAAPTTSHDPELAEEDHLPETLELAEPPVPPQYSDARPPPDPTEIGYELENGTTGTVRLHEDSADDVGEDEEEEEDRPVQSGVAEAATEPRLVRPPSGAKTETHAKLSMDEILEAAAGGDAKGLRLNLSAALKGSGKDGSSELADNVVKAFSALLSDFKDLVDASSSLSALESLSGCDNGAEFCPAGVCRRVDQPAPRFSPLHRLLNAMYAKQRRPRPPRLSLCWPSEEARQAAGYNRTPPNARFFSAPLLSTDGVVRQVSLDEFPYVQLGQSRFDLLSCPLPSFLSRFTGLGQVMPVSRIT